MVTLSIFLDHELPFGVLGIDVRGVYGKGAGRGDFGFLLGDDGGEFLFELKGCLLLG